MSNILAYSLFVSLFLISFISAENELPPCYCDDVGFWSVDNILECQKVSDFLIAVAYFSIPIELIYFVTCSNFPFKFKWVLVEFIAFIVLCGMTHLLNVWTYGPHSFRLMVALTIFKVLTAFVSFATAITLMSLFPRLIGVKIRELMLRKKACDLGREVGMIRKQTEAGMHVRMLTQEIRKSLDRHTILYTTLVELSKALNLQNCAIWMPNEDRTVVKLLHELKARDVPSDLTIPRSDPDVLEIKGSHGVKVLNPYSTIAVASCGSGSDPMFVAAGMDQPGPVAAIRMPILRVSNFKGGTPEMVPVCYAILVLVLPCGFTRSWTNQELEIVEVVADQVTVALSHAAVLEESQHITEQLEEQNRALLLARKDALMASQARIAFQMVMSNGLRRPMHSILGLLSLMQDENLASDQNLLVGAMYKTSNVLSALINDTVDNSDNGKFFLKVNRFRLHSVIKEAICIANCLCVYKGCKLSIEVDKCLPDYVMGDERRVFQVILHMIGSLFNRTQRVGALVFRVLALKGSHGRNEQGPWRSNSYDGHVYVRFEVETSNKVSQLESPSDSMCQLWQRHYAWGANESLSFNICRKLVQLMQGDIWMVSHQERFNQGMTLVLGFQTRPSTFNLCGHLESSDQPHSISLPIGLGVLLADNDDVNRAVTRKLLEKIGCVVSTASSGFECLSTLARTSTFQIVLVDLHMSELDGFEMTLRIRKFHSRNRPLIVALTTSDDEDTLDRCCNVGIHGILRKPVILQEIKDEFHRVLQVNRG